MFETESRVKWKIVKNCEKLKKIIIIIIMSIPRELILSVEEYQSLNEAEREHYIASLFSEIVNDTGFSDDDDANELQFGEIEHSDTEELPSTVPYIDVVFEDSDDDDDDDLPTQGPFQSQTYVASDGTEWNSQPTAYGRVLHHNILRQRCGPVKHTEMLNIHQSFQFFMSLEMVDIIVRHTNKKANKMYNEFNEKNPTAVPKVWKDVTVAELYGFLGILIMLGANRSSKEYKRLVER